MQSILSHLKHGKRLLLCLVGGLLSFLALTLLLQTVVAHRTPVFVPNGPPTDLSGLLSQPSRSDEDYALLFGQTGLSRSAIDDLLSQGEAGKALIVLIQEQFQSPLTVRCHPLFSIFTREDRLENSAGQTALAPYIPSLQDGDVLITFSTHSFGWRHGHAGIVVNALESTTLEAALIGTNSLLMPAGHWRQYSNFVVLRLKELTPELRKELAHYCTEFLLGVPYRLASGLWGAKAPALDASLFGVQCSYLVWYAFQAFGFDVDGDGGRLVSVLDLATSPLFEVVQVYGIDPAIFPLSDPTNHP